MKKIIKALLVLVVIFLLTSCVVTAGGSKYSFDDNGEYDEEEAKNDDFTINDGEDEIDFPGNYDPDESSNNGSTPENENENVIIEKISGSVCTDYVQNKNIKIRLYYDESKTCNNHWTLESELAGSKVSNLPGGYTKKNHIYEANETITLERYLKGVTVSEMSASNNIEALKFLMLIAKNMLFMRVVGYSSYTNAAGEYYIPASSCFQNYKDARYLDQYENSSKYKSKIDEVYEDTKDIILLNPDGKFTPTHYASSFADLIKKGADEGYKFYEMLNYEPLKQHSTYKQDYTTASYKTCGKFPSGYEETTPDPTPSPEPTPDPTPQPTPQPAPSLDPTPDPTPSSTGQKIADYALKMYNEKNGEFRYISPSAANANTYRINTYNDTKSEGYLRTDCNGFVGYVLHYALGIGPSRATSISDVKFAAPSSNSWKPTKSKLKVIATGLTLDEALSQAQVGDLLGSNGESTHIQIFIGNGKIIDNGNAKKEKPIGLRCKSTGSGCPKKILHQNDKFTILRVSD